MRPLVLLCVLALAACAGGPNRGGGYPQSLPGGSWRETCRDPYLRGDTLAAICRTSDGGWRETRIDVDNCRNGRFENDDGRLVCERRSGGGGWSDGGTRGSYLASCRDVRQDGPMIQARCQDRDGTWNTSRIDARNCDQDIANIDGRLACADWRGGDRWRR